MSQEALIRDVLKTWEMTNCRALVKPGEDTNVELPVEQNVDPVDVHRAQRLAGSLIWLSTRTRPDNHLCTIQNFFNGDESTKESILWKVFVFYGI